MLIVAGRCILGERPQKLLGEIVHKGTHILDDIEREVLKRKVTNGLVHESQLMPELEYLFYKETRAYNFDFQKAAGLIALFKNEEEMFLHISKYINLCR